MRDKRPVRKSFPINYMLEERQVLVVGGGRVGQRKVELLLEAGTQVSLVCPECVAELQALAQSDRIAYHERPFEERDVVGMSLVFACTDDKHLNRHILQVAKEAGVLSCSADGNWAHGDFITPAILRAGDIMLAISTSGKSCRQSRLVKDNLHKHLDSIESSDLLVLGINHDSLAVEERSKFHLGAAERAATGAMLRQVWGVHEFFILNTCNRIELVAAVSKDATKSGILRRLLGFDTLAPELYYMKHGFEAFAHLSLVTAGMDSQVPGESHVTSQMKEAVEEAMEQGWAGSIIRELADAALHISKDIHREIDPLMDVDEIEGVGLRYLDQHHPAPSNTRALVIGTGMVGQGLVAGLLARGYDCIWAYYRNRPQLSAEGARRIEVVQLDDLATVLPEVAVVISAVDSRQAVLTASEHAASLPPAGIFMIDLGMPRNLDPALKELPGVELADLDTLKHWYRTASGTLNRILEICHKILKDHKNIYERMRKSIQGDSNDA